MNLSCWQRLLLLVILASVLLICRPSHAAELSGSVSGDLYTYTDSSETHVRPYFRLYSNLTAWRPDNNHFLRVNSSLRWRTDLADQFENDPQLFVYEANAHLRAVRGRLDTYLGRQFVYSSIGSALIDGGLVRYRAFDHLSLELLGGSAVASANPETINALNEHLTVGGKITGRPDRDSRITMAWMLRRRNSQESLHRIGIDAYRFLGSIEAYARYAYNVTNRNTAEVTGRMMYRNEDWYGSFEFQWREPAVWANSIFAIVDYDRYQIARLDVHRRLRSSLFLTATLQRTLIQDDEALRIGVGFRSPHYSLMWLHQSGYAGKNDGIRGSAHISFLRRWQAYASADLFRYRIQPEHDLLSDAYTSSLGLRCRAGRGVSFEIEGQYLRNAVYHNDTRLFLRVTKNFAFRSSSGGKS